MRYYFLFHLLCGFMSTGGTILAFGMLKRKDKYVMHPNTVVKNILIINFILSLRVFIFGFTWLINGQTSLDFNHLKDFGFLDYGWKLESILDNGIMVCTILWNLCWTYELYISVKNPMVFSEMNFAIYSKLLNVIGVLISVFLILQSDSNSNYTLFWQSQNSDSRYFTNWFIPTIVSTIVWLLANLKYGKEFYLKTFRKNSHKFLLLFRLHYYYMIFGACWSVFKFAPMIINFKTKASEEEWAGFSSLGICLYPFGMLVWFTTAWFFNKKYYFQELSKIGHVEKLLSVESNLKNFKEVIRKEVCEQIVRGMTIIFSEPEIFHALPDYDDKAAENMKKNNIEKVKDAFINYAKKTRDKLTSVDVKDRNIRKQVDLISNAQILKESRAKRSFYLGDHFHSWSIEEYAPRIFQNIRRIYNIKNEDILNIFKEGFEENLDINISTGKTGSFFLKNLKQSDLQIKSIRLGEYRNMTTFTHDYYKYLLTNENTLITPILGLFTINLSGDSDQIDPINFVLLKFIIPQTIIPKNPPSNLSSGVMIFDLKGSTYGRRAIKDKSDLQRIYLLDQSILTTPLKDWDFNEGIKSLNIFQSHPNEANLLLDQIK